MPGSRPISTPSEPGTFAVVHEVPAGDVVTVQRRLPAGERLAVVSYRVPAEASTDDLPLLHDAVARLAFVGR